MMCDCIVILTVCICFNLHCYKTSIILSLSIFVSYYLRKQMF